MTTKKTETVTPEVTEIDRLKEGIRVAVGNEPLTMYRFATISSNVLGRKIREQMMYNYRTKKLIRTNEDGRVTPEVAVEFLLKRVLKSLEED